MTDWNKLKVPELKAELRRRALPQTGLKAELVARLAAADVESGFESETTIKGDPVEATLDSNTPTDASIETDPTLTQTQPEANASVDSQILRPHDDAESSISIPKGSAAPTNEIEASESQPFPPSSNDKDFSKASELEDSSRSNLPSVDSLEAIEDTQKRKRRSQSPPPSATDVRRKRARQGGEMLTATSNIEAPKEDVFTSRGDAEWIENHNGAGIAMVNAEADEVAASSPGSNVGPITVNEAKEEVRVARMVTVETEAVDPSSGVDDAAGKLTAGHEGDFPALSPDEVSSTRTKDTRFKDLFSVQSGSSAQDPSSDKPRTHIDSSDTMDVEPGDRSVAPSIHPATSALYIRDFMRPLNAAALKEHLTILATTPGTTPDSGTIIDFYLDPIRTHAFISFKSISAASRVRSELHDRIWPNERNRKPLWADFIPLEKVQEWISEEQSSASGVRSARRKWEVVYSFDIERNVTVALKEAGGISAPVGKPSVVSATSTAPSRSGIEGAPSGPRALQASGQRAASSLSTLGQLFRSTIAKPVLYYQPVSRELAERRLLHIDDAISKHYSNRTGASEINRYTFEDRDVLVDRGPEIFSGIRPPPGYRGRGGGGGGRGGGRRGREGGYGGRGGDRYEGSGRDSRDLRDRRY